MITAEAIKYAGEGIVNISIGWFIVLVFSGIGLFLSILLKVTVDRYFKKLDEKSKEEKDKATEAKKFQESVLENLSNMNKGLNEVNTKHIYMLEKINRTEHTLEETVKDVGLLKFEVGIMRELRKKAG